MPLKYLQNPSKSTKMPPKYIQNASKMHPKCIKMHSKCIKIVPKCTKMHSKCSKMHQNCTKVQQLPLKCTKMVQNAPKCSKMLLAPEIMAPGHAFRRLCGRRSSFATPHLRICCRTSAECLKKIAKTEWCRKRRLRHTRNCRMLADMPERGSKIPSKY